LFVKLIVTDQLYIPLNIIY